MKIKIKGSQIQKNKLSFFPILIMVILVVYAIALFGLLAYALFVSTRSAELKDFSGSYFAMKNKNFYFHLHEIFEKIYISTSTGDEVTLLGILSNSLIYSIGSALLKTITPCIAAYACARFNFKTGKVVYTAVLMAMIIPIVGSLPSELRVTYALGLVNSLPGVIMLKANMLGLYFFVMYATFKSMPSDYFEAARIDGANNFQIFFRIAFPLVKNVFLTIVLINFVFFWNDYQTPMIYLRDKPTLGITLWKMITGAGAVGDTKVSSNAVYALNMVILSSTPVLVLFSIFKDKFMGNLTMGGIKG